ncbi:MAG TPA: phytanoyl-CoA dioxygenase family protein [Capsulimonadaceae bacterium]|jgi:ectoine hydroxylase-related dioxygenase (phytanoyl-CoA dioxygenase family)
MPNSKNITDTPLSPEIVAQYHRDGYISLPDILSPVEIVAARDAFTQMVRERIARGDAPPPPDSPMVQFEAGFDTAEGDIEAAELRVRKFMFFVRSQPTLAALVQPDHIICRIVKQLIGPSPIMFQDMALVKPAFIGSEKPWHQDNAYFSVAPLDSICGVWIALDDAEVANGCMHVLPGRHKDGALTHHHGTDCEIATDKLPLSEVLPVPIAAGGAMFFYGMLPHQTPPNRSPDRRRALQFHFRTADSRILPADEYDTLYAENGQPASCAAARLGI